MDNLFGIPMDTIMLVLVAIFAVAIASVGFVRCNERPHVPAWACATSRGAACRPASSSSA